MKKVISSLLVLSMVLLGTVAKAGNITAEQAKVIGAYYFGQQTGNTKLTPEQLRLDYQFENRDLNVASAYVFNVAECGWIIIAGSSLVDPVIAYSEEGSIDMNVIPDNLRWWLNGYTDIVADIQRMNAEKDYPDSEEYTELTGNALKDASKNEKINLMTTTWNQGSEYNPTYNLYCPVFSGRTSVTGCVATAMSQICKYYEYPVQPKGTVSDPISDGRTLSIKLDTVQFNYSLMPNYLSSSSSTQQIREVAKLNYCIGVAVRMNYSPDGSGANSYYAMSQMKFRFKYKQGTYRQRTSDSDTNFVLSIRRSLMAGDVVYMGGESSTGSGGDADGHAWVCTGYQTDEIKKYWMNWGWGGSGNGWYNLYDNNMRISSNGWNFNVNQECILGMVPPEDSNIRHNHVAIREVETDNTLLGSAYPNPASLSVMLPYTTQTAADMQVYSIDGKLVATRRVQPGSGAVTLRVDALPNGVYIYRLNGQSGKFIVR